MLFVSDVVVTTASYNASGTSSIDSAADSSAGRPRFAFLSSAIVLNLQAYISFVFFELLYSRLMKW